MAMKVGRRVSKTRDIEGGDACLHGTRIPVWVLEGYRRLGVSDAELLSNYPSLCQSDLESAWAYVADHGEEIDRAIHENEEGEQGPVE